MGSESMKNLIQNWRSSMSGDRNVLKEFQILKEGLFDLGLPGEIVEMISSMFIKTPEKGKTIIGNLFKNSLPRDKFGPDNRRKLRELAKTFEDLLLEAGHPHFQDQLRTDVHLNPHILEIYAKEAFVQFIKYSGADYVDPGERRQVSLAKAKKYALKTLENGLGVGTKKYPVSEEHIQEFEQAFDEIIHDIAQWFSKTYELVARWLNAHPDNYKDLVAAIGARFIATRSMPRALIEAEEWLKDFNEEKIIHMFNDGFYWYDLRRAECDVEGIRMGHCGFGETGATLLSLRKQKEGKKHPSSYITISYDPSSKTIYQIKGKNNLAPKKSFWDYIAWLINSLKVKLIEEEGEGAVDYSKFREMNQYLSRKTSAEVPSGWGAIEKELQETKESYNKRYTTSSVDFQMTEDRTGQPSYSYSGELGIPVPIDDFKKEALEAGPDWAQNEKFLQELLSHMENRFRLSDITRLDPNNPMRKVIESDGYLVFRLPIYGGPNSTISISPHEFDNFASDVKVLDDFLAQSSRSLLLSHLKTFLASKGLLNVVEGEDPISESIFNHWRRMIR